MYLFENLVETYILNDPNGKFKCKLHNKVITATEKIIVYGEPKLVLIFCRESHNYEEYYKHLMKENSKSINLILKDRNYTPSNMNLLNKILKAANTPITFNLENDWMENSDTRNVIYVTKGINDLIELDLCKKDLKNNAAKDLSCMIKNNNTLIRVSLISNYIDVEGVKVIADALKDNLSITTLELKGNRFNSEGAEAIGEMLIYNKVLENLDLSNNAIGDKGINIVSNALEKNNTLTSLNLFLNRTREFEILKIIENLLVKDEALYKLYINYNTNMVIPMIMRLRKNGTQKVLIRRYHVNDNLYTPRELIKINMNFLCIYF